MKMKHLNVQLISSLYNTIGPGEDYNALAIPCVLRFGRCEKKKCVNVTIINDEMLEETESFNISLEGGRGVSSRFVFSPQEVSITITDEDGT